MTTVRKHKRRTKKGRTTVKKHKRKVKHKKNFGMGWSGKTGVPIGDYPESYGYTKEVKEISPDEYIDLAWESHGKEGTREDYLKNIWDPHVKKLEKPLKSKKKIMNEPWIELREGKPVEQEGRHRATAAKNLGMEKIPVHFIETRPDDYSSKRDERTGVIKSRN